MAQSSSYQIISSIQHNCYTLLIWFPRHNSLFIFLLPNCCSSEFHADFCTLQCHSAQSVDSFPSLYALISSEMLSGIMHLYNICILTMPKFLYSYSVLTYFVYSFTLKYCLFSTSFCINRSFMKARFSVLFSNASKLLIRRISGIE